MNRKNNSRAAYPDSEFLYCSAVCATVLTFPGNAGSALLLLRRSGVRTRRRLRRGRQLLRFRSEPEDLFRDRLIHRDLTVDFFEFVIAVLRGDLPNEIINGSNPDVIRIAVLDAADPVTPHTIHRLFPDVSGGRHGVQPLRAAVAFLEQRRHMVRIRAKHPRSDNLDLRCC